MATPKITIFSTATCPFCKMEKAFLKEKGVSFEERSVDVDQSSAEEMVKLTNQMGVPVTVLEYDDGSKTCFIGFRQELLEKSLTGVKVGEPCRD
ncbi:MAG: glutaredoxin family protein [Patescibacteria group bacterium]